jgi:hypothetical protein
MSIFLNFCYRILLHAPQALLNFTGNDDLKKYGEKIGNAYLTSHRLIFIAKKNSQNLHSFSFPFVVLSQVDVEQPMFGAFNVYMCIYLNM